MQLTSAGKLLTVIVGLIVFITTLRHLMKNELLDEENDFMNAMTVIVMFFFSNIVTFFSVVIVYSIFFFHTKLLTTSIRSIQIIKTLKSSLRQI